MKKGIIICGLNGAGKSTLAKELSDQTGYRYLDVEHFYFPEADSKHPFSVVRKKDEVEALIIEEMKKGPFILASVTCDFKKELISYLDLIVKIEVKKEERLKRIRDRSIKRFGKRVLPDGDMYESEENYYQKIAQRDESSVDESIKNLNIEILHLNGSQPIQENIQKIYNKLND